VPSLQLALWAGPDAVLPPFVYQLGRQGNPESLYTFLAPFLPAPRALFLLGQVALALYFALAVPRTARGVIIAAAAIVMGFELCTRFHSPQWVLWTAPLVMAAARNRTQLTLCVAMDLLTYLTYPIAWDAFGPGTPSFTFILGAFDAVRVWLLVALLADDGREGARAPAPASCSGREARSRAGRRQGVESSADPCRIAGGGPVLGNIRP
jgi:hypothetical protein